MTIDTNVPNSNAPKTIPSGMKVKTSVKAGSTGYGNCFIPGACPPPRHCVTATC